MDSLLKNFEILSAPHAPPQILIGGALCPNLTLAARNLDRYIAKSSVKTYSRVGVAMFGAVEATRLQQRADADAWSPTHISKQLWQETLVQLGCRLEHQIGGYYHVTPPEHLHNAVVTGLSAASHLYNAAREIGVTDCNPLQIRDPVKRREPVSRFRAKLSAGSVRTTREPADVAQVIKALRAKCPPQVVMLFELMSEGLARLSEQAKLTVWDWAQFDFQQSIATPNKGDGAMRSKTQVIAPALWGRMIHWFDNERDDPNDLDRATYRRLAKTPPGKALMSETPLFPNCSGGFYTYSGLVDVHFRPAMTGALAGTTTHGIRIAGINAFIAWIDSLPISPAEKAEERSKFAEHMGWRWADDMLDYYTAPHRRKQIAALATRFASANSAAIEAISTSPEQFLLQEKPVEAPHNGGVERIRRLTGGQ